MPYHEVGLITSRSFPQSEEGPTGKPRQSHQCHTVKFSNGHHAIVLDGSMEGEVVQPSSS